MNYIEIDNNGYFICDYPGATGDEPNAAPHTAANGTIPDGMRKARYINDSWVDEEAESLAADLAVQALKSLERALETHMDSVAQTDGWDNRWSCVARAAYPNPWQAKAVAFGGWMDACWVVIIQAQADIAAGTRTVPMIEEAIAELPAMVWPS